MNKEEHVFTYGEIGDEFSLRFYFCGREECEPGHSFGPAVRTQYLLHFVTQGKGSYTVHGKTLEVGQGQVFLIYPGEVTFYRADTEDPWTYRWLAFHGYEAEKIMKRCGFTREYPVVDYAQGEEERKEQVEILLEELFRLFDKKRQGEYGLKGYLYLIFDQMERPVNQEGEWGKLYVQKAKEYMTANFTYDLKIQDVAGYVGIDRTYLYRLFMEYQGKSPWEYLLGLRLQQAQTMLGYTDRSVTLIACSCGFKDSPSFCRHFKNVYGKTPLAYRREQKLFLEGISRKHGAEGERNEKL